VRAAEIVRAAVIGAEIAVGAADVLVAADVGAVAVDGREAGVDATAVTAAVEAEAGTKLFCHGFSRIRRINTDQPRRAAHRVRPLLVFGRRLIG